MRVAVARARVAHGRGEATEALALLDAVEDRTKNGPLLRAWRVTRARACLRAGRATRKPRTPPRRSSPRGRDRRDGRGRALAIRGLSLAYDGKDPQAKADLTQGGSPREGPGRSSWCSPSRSARLGIAPSEGGPDRRGARATYEAALAEAEGARDAATVATIRLNLSNVAQFDGDLALGLQHLEAAVDMGRRAGALVAVQTALMNLTSLDLYLGRYARAGASIDALDLQKEQLSAVTRADLLGHQADLAARTGDVRREPAKLYEECATRARRSVARSTRRRRAWKESSPSRATA